VRAGRGVALICAVACLGAATALAAPAPGSAALCVDRSFGSGGIAHTELPPTYEVEPFVEVAAMADGGALAKAGRFISSSYHRYRADGSLESSYEIDGAQARPEAVEANGKRLSVNEHAVLRSNSDGSPDATFGSGGASEKLPFEIEAIVPLSSGSILLGGNGSYINGGTKGGNYDQVYVARLTAAGKLDPVFGETGVVELTRDEMVDGEDFVQLVPRPGDGAVVGVNAEHASVAALDGSGKLDRGFGEAGVVKPSGPIVGVEATSDGALLVAGERRTTDDLTLGSGRFLGTDFVLARYTAAGQLDRSFAAGNGAARVDLGGQDEAHAVHWEANGSVVIAGSNTPETVACRRLAICQVEPVLLRFDAAGGLDPSFGSGGVVRLRSLVGPAERNHMEGVAALAARPGGGLLAAGGTSLEAFVAALAPNGSLDPSFDTDGIVGDRTLEPSETRIGTLTVDAQGRILVAGLNDAATPELSPTAVLRYLPDGRLDTSFGEGGYTRVPEGVGEVAAAADGSTFVVSNGGQLAVTKLTPDGHADSSFGSEGLVPLGDDKNRAPGGEALALLPDGDLLVAGSVPIRGGRVVMFRLHPNGSLDRDFGTRGEAVLDFGADRSWQPLRMAVAPSGRIILAGHSNRRHGKSWYVDNLALMAVRDDGRIDRGFGNDGSVIAPVPGRGYATGLALQGGKILIAGETSHDDRVADVLLRYRRDGSLDRSFARQGVAKVPVRSVEDRHEFWSERLSVVPAARRILLVRGSQLGRPVLAFGREGERNRRFEGSENLIPGPHGGTLPALQGGQLILAWTANPGRRTPLGRGDAEVRLGRIRLP
jgi:uncharacterized delta-60 repeat protein